MDYEEEIMEVGAEKMWISRTLSDSHKPMKNIETEIDNANGMKRDLMIDDFARFAQLAESLRPPLGAEATADDDIDPFFSHDGYLDFPSLDDHPQPHPSPSRQGVATSASLSSSSSPSRYSPPALIPSIPLSSQIPTRRTVSEELPQRGSKRDLDLGGPHEAQDTNNPSPRRKRARWSDPGPSSAPLQVNLPVVHVPESDPTLPAQPLAPRRVVSRTALMTTSVEQLGKIDFAATAEVNATQLTSLRDRYHNRLCTEKTGRPGKSTGLLFTPSKAAQLTAYFFEHAQGANALEHVANFLENWPIPFDQAGTGLISHALQISQDPTVPSLIRDFFDLWDMHRILKNHSEPVVQHIHGFINSQCLLRQYEAIVAAIRDRDVALVQYYTELGIKPGSGLKAPNLTLAIFDKLGKFRDGKRTDFTQEFERTRVFNVFAEKLGPAFFLLTPPKSRTLLAKMGQQCARAGCDIFLELCPYMKDVVALLDRWIWQQIPLNPPTFQVDVDILAQGSGDRSFLETLRQATGVNTSEEGHTNGPITREVETAGNNCDLEDRASQGGQDEAKQDGAKQDGAKQDGAKQDEAFLEETGFWGDETMDPGSLFTSDYFDALFPGDDMFGF